MTKQLVESLADEVVAVLKNALVARDDRLNALEKRLIALEVKPHVKFCGVHERGKSYQPGDACVHDGGLWIARAETTGEPSKDFVGWTLAVKSRSIAR